MLGGALALGLVAGTELLSRHPTRNATEGVYHLTKGVYAREWWLGGIGLGVVVAGAFAAFGVITGSLIAPALGGVAAMAGIWFADNAYVKAGQSVPLS